jgi:acetyl esterase
VQAALIAKLDVDESWVTDAAMDTDTYRTFKDGPYISANMMPRFWDNYLPNPGIGVEITASPLRATRDDLRGLPPALVIVDENDILRDEGGAYASKLCESGVPTTSVRYNDIIHDFMMPNALSDTDSTRAATSQPVAALRRAFGATSS